VGRTEISTSILRRVGMERIRPYVASMSRSTEVRAAISALALDGELRLVQLALEVG